MISNLRVNLKKNGEIKYAAVTWCWHGLPVRYSIERSSKKWGPRLHVNRWPQYVERLPIGDQIKDDAERVFTGLIEWMKLNGVTIAEVERAVMQDSSSGTVEPVFGVFAAVVRGKEAGYVYADAGGQVFKSTGPQDELAEDLLQRFLVMEDARG